LIFTSSSRLECSGKEIPDEVMKNAMSLAHEAIQPIIEAQEKAVANTTAQNMTKNNYSKVSEELQIITRELGWQSALEVYGNTSDVKAMRGRAEGKLRSKLSDELASHPVASLEPTICRNMAIDKIMNAAFRAVTIGLSPESKPVRVDGRSPSQLRPISCGAAVLPMVHGSAYFTRGDTHVLCTTTLGSREDALVC
jgi:polyribonucleotide nucleotidyltransferase